MPGGRRPTPTKILQLRGSWRAKTRPHEPQVKAERPTCPSWLSGEAKQVWRVIVPQLHAMGILTKVDGQALARYCALTVRWRHALQFVEAHGDTYPVRDANGQVVSLRPFPQTWLVQNVAKELLRLESHFGMTPSARTTLHVHSPAPAEAADPKTKFFRPSLRS